MDLLYHESIYLEDMKHMTQERGHATAKEAASIAAQAEVGQLLLGHFSSRYKYKDLSPFITAAQTVFPRVVLTIEGETFYLGTSKK